MSNPTLLAATGHNVRLLRSGAFAAAGLAVGLSALVSGYDVGFGPTTGMNAVVVGFVAAVVGGPGSLPGAIVAGLAVGVVRTEVTWFFSAQWADATTFLLLAFGVLTRQARRVQGEAADVEGLE